MVYVAAGLVVVGAVAGLNLLLTFGVIRRLRQHTDRLTAIDPPGPPTSGDQIGPFMARTNDGQAVSRETLRPGWLVVFLSPGCPPCEAQLPELVKQLREAGRPRTATLVVILADVDEAAGMISELEPLATVVCEPPPAKDLQAAFGVWSAPLGVVVDGSRISDVFTNVAEIPALARPAAVAAP